MLKNNHLDSLLREPLVHFVALGVLVFAIDYASSAAEDSPNAIVIGPSVHEELIEIFRASRGREPDAAELEVLRERWMDNEVLYREGLALRLDQGDSAIRDRVIFKALNVAQANLELPPVDDAELEQWFEQNRARYDEPERVDFLEAVIEGNPSTEAVAAFVAALNAATETDVQSGLRVFRGRPRDSIVASFGEAFTEQLAVLPTERWHMLQSVDGARAILIERRAEPVPARFVEVRTEVLQDWRDRRMQELRTAAVRELAKKYVISIIEPEQRLAATSPSETAR